MIKSLSEKPFGNFNGEEVTEYTFTNENEMQVSIINYGGTVTKIITKDKYGKDGDVILGYETLSGYLQKENPYFGCLIGRYGNRIANGQFTVDGKTYHLAKNNNGQCLHGGINGYDKVIWNVKAKTDCSITLNYLSKDGEEGFPGNLNIEVIYELTSDNGLKISYTATTDKATPINLTNHCYFNLSCGEDATILQHELQLNANRFTEVDMFSIPTGNLPDVKNTSMDFNVAKTIGKDIASLEGGYDHNFILSENKKNMSITGTLYHPTSGRLMEVYTNEPAIQFYTGNFLDGTLTDTKHNQKYVKHAGLCLETQHYPDSPNQPDFPNTILNPEEKYFHNTLYKFSLRK
jgi:aldose 1-epimerase